MTRSSRNLRAAQPRRARRHPPDHDVRILVGGGRYAPWREGRHRPRARHRSPCRRSGLLGGVFVIEQRDSRARRRALPPCRRDCPATRAPARPGSRPADPGGRGRPRVAIAVGWLGIHRSGRPPCLPFRPRSPPRTSGSSTPCRPDRVRELLRTRRDLGRRPDRTRRRCRGCAGDDRPRDTARVVERRHPAPDRSLGAGGPAEAGPGDPACRWFRDAPDHGGNDQRRHDLARRVARRVRGRDRRNVLHAVRRRRRWWPHGDAPRSRRRQGAGTDLLSGRDADRVRPRLGRPLAPRAG